MTKTTFKLLLFILMSALTNHIYAADWSFGGGAKNAKGNTEFQFIDRNSISSTDNATIRFWVKSISEKNINRYDKQHEKESVKEGAKRLMEGYSPDVLFLDRYKKSFKNSEELENARYDIISKET
ncbi:MAG: hypothetical protein GJU76_05220, partial [Gallionella sp.]|nr:hypothetical protein [Gallionella sp.]